MTARGTVLFFGSALRTRYRERTCRTFRSCRLYSWMRLTWQSKRARESTETPVRARIVFARAFLLSCLTVPHARRNSAFSARGARRQSCSRSVTHPSPILSVISSARPGLHSFNHRRGVMPLVLLLNLSGQRLKKSRKISVLRISVWSPETPFTEWLPTMARWDMRSFSSPSSLNSDMRRSRSVSRAIGFSPARGTAD